MSVLIGRPINGISVNGLEFVLNADGSEMTFSSVESANQFLLDNGFTQEDIDHSIIFKEQNTLGGTIHV
jgi:hypothetical protein